MSSSEWLDRHHYPIMVGQEEDVYRALIARGMSRRRYAIKVVHRDTPDAEGRWIDCGEHPASHMYQSFRGSSAYFKQFAPPDHEVVAVTSRRIEE